MARPKLPWRYPTEYCPPEGVDIYIRRLPFYDKPTLSEFIFPDSFYLKFWEPLSLPNQCWIPVGIWEIHSWKFRYQEDEDDYKALFPGS